MSPKQVNYGFTLIELSIVLIIISLIVGGVIGGKSLIISAERNKQISQLKQFATAFNVFRDQYDALPGDFREASQYWVECVDSGANNCDGDGNNAIGDGSTAHTENTRAWEHLSHAGLINETFRNDSPVLNPQSIWTRGIMMRTKHPVFDYSYKGTRLETQPNENGETNKLMDIVAIDKKMDDGKPGLGKIRCIGSCISTFGMAYPPEPFKENYVLAGVPIAGTTYLYILFYFLE